MAKVNETFCLYIPSKTIFIETVLDLAESFFKINLNNESVINSEIASISEAVSNAIIHGNKKDPGKDVYLTINIKDNSVITKIEDSNKKYYDYLKNYKYDKEDILKSSGRGLFIIETYMDNISLKKGKKGTIIKMEKSLK